MHQGIADSTTRRPLEQTVPWVLAGTGWPAEVEQGSEDDAYNLIVDDFRTYFVEGG